jgi:hypothetical protein
MEYGSFGVLAKTSKMDKIPLYSPSPPHQVWGRLCPLPPREREISEIPDRK